jgi:hypothetical protein
MWIFIGLLALAGLAIVFTFPGVMIAFRNRLHRKRDHDDDPPSLSDNSYYR